MARNSIILRSIRWSKKLIAERIKNDGKIAIAALMRVYSFQAAEEKIKNTTLYDNGVGFNTFDAPILTSLAQQYKKKGFLSARQTTIIKERMPKYAGQLFDYILEQNGNRPLISVQLDLFGPRKKRKT